MNYETDIPGFEVALPDEEKVADLVSARGLAPLTARILVSRGIDTAEAVDRFFSPSLERDWLDPALIPGLVEVADAVEAAIRAGKRILVFGDFDVDGVSAATVGVRGLRALGADVVGLIPHRYEEGYALTEKAVARARTYDPDLIVTVDCGISCADEVAKMLDEGLEVCITDHHEPGAHVPQGVPVADPKLDADCPSRDLAGVGVALKLVCLLCSRFGKPDLWRGLTDFATLGTIADLMSLSPENRALVADGIARINNDPRMCFLALSGICGNDPSTLTSTDLSFSFIPRLNAAGRMGDATLAYRLLTSDDRQECEDLAARLDEVNSERRAAEANLDELVEEQLSQTYHGQAAIVAAGEGWHEGVKGIVASRIARRYKRPTIIFTIQDGVARGSGRSYGGINLFELVSRQADELDAFGGHAAAVGVTIAEDRLKEFSERLSAAVESVLKSGAPEPRRIDTAVDLAECTVEGYDELERLQPFGNDNPTPLLVARNVFLERRSAVGKQGTHFRFDATDGNARVSGIYFSPDNLEELLSCQSACDVVFEPSIDEWQGRRTAKLMCRGIFEHKASVVLQTEISQRVDELFMHSVEISDTGEYAGITQQARFFTKVVGVTFENRQQVLSRLESGVELRLEREPENEVDRNAIAVKTLGGEQLGFLNRHLAARLAPVMDEGAPYDAAVSEVTGGPAEGREDEDTRIPGPLGVRDPGVVDRSYGVNIIVRRGDIEEEPEVDPDEHAAQLAKARAKWAQLDADELDDELREALIGEHSLHNAQKRTLDNLAQGRSTLTIMATGRGKSLIFHLHAARCALKDNNASVFIYPLRALVADQAFHLQETFARFGLSVCVLTGESDEAERSRIFEGLSAGTVDVILTTPEFLSIHAEQFARTGRIGFLVVDEAHHIAQAKAGNRAAYAHLDTTIKALGNPLVLAVTATAGDAATRDICSTLGISELVVDPTVRENLAIDDKRDLRNREGYLAHLIAGGGKTVAYVNSRETSIELTRKLRKRLPELAPRIAFYNAGLAKEDRKNIETAFRDGDLVAIVSTSAFGEGIDIPDIEHVVLFHLPFNDIEFNQMSGRAGRDGRAAQVHLLYSYGDARINESILSASAPSHEQLAALYRVLCDEAKAARERGEEGFSCTNAELAEKAGRAKRSVHLTDSAVSCGISVFKELGFLETRGKSVSRRIFMVEHPAHRDLEESVRYREGKDELTVFEDFKRWALEAGSDELLARFNRPIVPTDQSLDS